jgi:hypothetical protein
MEAGQVQILLFAAKQLRLNGNKPLQLVLPEGGVQEPAGAHSIFQALEQDLIILLRPVVHKGVRPDHPLSIAFSPAVLHRLMADEIPEQLPVQLIF